jgi:PTH1 family peptidyl-tRNA hydrolase
MPKGRFRLVVGLGNPGPAYSLTRHNAGFLVVDRLARQWGISLDEQRFESLLGVGRVQGKPVILAKPMTYMNLSGPAVHELAHFFNLDREDILAIHDDLDLVFGKIKIKQKGGDGGHKGVKSLIEAFGSGEFDRLRIGIGRPESGQESRDYVLSTFDAHQETLLEDVISAAQDAVETILFKGVTEAMNRFHGRENF